MWLSASRVPPVWDCPRFWTALHECRAVRIPRSCAFVSDMAPMAAVAQVHVRCGNGGDVSFRVDSRRRVVFACAPSAGAPAPPPSPNPRRPSGPRDGADPPGLHRLRRASVMAALAVAGGRCDDPLTAGRHASATIHV